MERCINTVNSWKKQFRVYSFLCNNKAKLKISSIAKLLQEIAWEHAEKLGAGYHALSKKNLAWILYGLRIHIREIPDWNDLLEIETWGKRFENLFAYRDFILRKKGQDEAIIKATSSWLVINIKNQRPQRITGSLLNLPRMEKDAIDRKPADFDNAPEYEASCLRKVVYSDIDINNHVNNTNYIKFCIDAVKELQENVLNIATVDIRFVHEARLDDEIKLNYTPIKNGYQFLAVHHSSSNEVFRAKIELKNPTS